MMLLSLLLFVLLSLSLELSSFVLVLTCWECGSGTFVKGCQLRVSTQGETGLLPNELQQLLKVVTDLQKWEYMVLIFRTGWRKPAGLILGYTNTAVRS